MTKLLNIILLTIILSSSCCCGEPEPKYLDPNDGVYMGVEKVALSGADGVEDAFTIKMARFTLYGHDYILFYQGRDRLNGVTFEDNSWVHDPNCQKCKGEDHKMSILTPETSDFWSW